MIKKILSKTSKNKLLQNSHDRVVSFSRNKIGLIDINKEISRGNLQWLLNVVNITDEIKKGNIIENNQLIDLKTGLIYRIKYNNFSGGNHNSRKELYESLISRMVAKFGNCVEYFPCEFNGSRGVLSLDWCNTGYNYSLLSSKCCALNLKELEMNENFINGCTKPVLKTIKKVPQHFMVGNCDYIPRNVAYRLVKGNIADILLFDFGYSTFSKVENSLNKDSLSINVPNIRQTYLHKTFEKFYNSTIGMGANYNIVQYSSFDALYGDFRDYARQSKEFRDNINDAIIITGDFDEEIRKMKDEGFKIYPDHEKIIRQVTEMNIDMFNNCL